MPSRVRTPGQQRRERRGRAATAGGTISRMVRAMAVLLFAVGVLTACGGGGGGPRVFAIADVYYPRGDFEGGGLVRVNPETLQPIGRALRLGDAVTSRTLSSDGRTLAFGGYNLHENLFVHL